jgi:quinol monooxygenase YgiN/predicted enzyme related to lactoylglutathione lyase
MNQNIKHISLVVKDYDEAIEFYVNKLKFQLIEDTKLDEEKRWVLIKPNGTNSFSLLLAKADNEKQHSRIGNQTGGRVFLFLNTDNFERDFENLNNEKIKIVRQPIVQPYGTVAVFEDLYGNLWDLIEPSDNQEQLYYSTGILKVLDAKKIDLTSKLLSKLASETRKENGNVSFSVHQSKEDPSIFILWECFKNETAFKIHLQSKHIKEFLSKKLVELQTGITSNKLY